MYIRNHAKYSDKFKIKKSLKDLNTIAPRYIGAGRAKPGGKNYHQDSAPR
jgi:hypothetical protein